MTFLLADKRNAFIINSGRWLSALLVTGLLCLPARAQTFADSSSQLVPLNNTFVWGCSAADFNNDGLVDIYHEGRLYLNKGKAGFVDVLSQTGINEGSNVFGSVFGDYNNDGYLDVLFEDFGPPSKLYRNDIRRHFTHVNAQVGLNVIGLTQGAAWGDYNLDGALDLYSNEDTGDNQLFENVNRQNFNEVTVTSGVVTQGNSYGTAWGDYNNDGFPDIFIATCNSSPFNSIKHLLRNNGDGTFTDVNYAAGVADSLASWGIVWLDYDNDGDWDIYIANTNHPPRPGHNKLYRNNGDETFTDVALQAGVQGVSSESSFGASAADFDNDGWIDIYVANSNHQHRLYRNNGDGTFSDIAPTAGITENNHQAAAVADFNNDGWMDIFSAGGPQNRLMINRGGSGNWIKINARGTVSNYFGVGTRVEVYAGGQFQMREIRAGDSFCSQNELFIAHFGLGSAVAVDSILLKWPGGIVDKLENVEVNQHVTIVEAGGLLLPQRMFQLSFPENNRTVRMLSQVQFTWKSAGADIPGEANGELSYDLHLWGSGLDTVISGLSGNYASVPAVLFNENQSYQWMIEARDGYSVTASREIFTFTYNRQAFEDISGNGLAIDDGYSEGVAWGDYDDDGDLDLFVANIINQNNLFYDNDGDGTFTQLSSGPVVNDGGFSYGGHFVDYDQDGDLDLYVINRGQGVAQANFLYDNDGGVFSKNTTSLIASEAAPSWSGAWADYDHDGYPDLFLANFNAANYLYHNNGDGTFERILSGDIVTDVAASLGCAWGDYDNDGDADLFVANFDPNFAGGPGQNNALYRNNGDGSFSKITAGAIVNDGGSSAGASWGDYDNDGDLDLFVTNYFDENNFLYENNGDGSFTPITAGIMVNDGGLSVGSAWGDYDNDGDLDLFVGDDGGANRLYENLGGGNFTAIEGVNIVNTPGRSNGAAWIDYDRDGDIDLFVANGDATPQSNSLYRNRMNSANRFLQLHLDGNASNYDAIGAKVRVKARIDGQPVWQLREASSQSGYNSHSSYEFYFGLGDAIAADTLAIYWPSGWVQVLTDVPAGQFLTIAEDSQRVVGLNGGKAVPEHFELRQNYPNPFNPATVIEYQLPDDSAVRLSVFNLLGQRVVTLVNARQPAGVYEVRWDGRDASGRPLASGIYLYRLETPAYSQSRKLVLLR